MASISTDPLLAEQLHRLADMVAARAVRKLGVAARKRAEAVKDRSVEQIMEVLSGEDHGHTYLDGLAQVLVADAQAVEVAVHPVVWARLARDLGAQDLKIGFQGTSIVPDWVLSFPDEDMCKIRHSDGSGDCYQLTPDGLNEDQGRLYLKVREQLISVDESFTAAQDTIPNKSVNRAR